MITIEKETYRMIRETESLDRIIFQEDLKIQDEKKRITDLEHTIQQKQKEKIELEQILTSMQNQQLQWEKELEVLVSDLQTAKEKIHFIKEESTLSRYEKQQEQRLLEQEELEQKLYQSLEKQDQLEKNLQLIHTYLNNVPKTLDIIAEDVTDNVRLIEKKICTLTHQRLSLLEELPSLIKEKLKSNHIHKKGQWISHIASVQEGKCTGCHIIINKKQWSALEHYQEFLSCPQCQRILIPTESM
jgi:predicted  nucleic acid-binding Zn-ribbon protein